MIKVSHKGDFSNTTRYFKRVKKAAKIENLETFGIEGVDALSSATPIDTGATANSWYYKITNEKGRVVISFNNSNIQNGVLIAIILQYGHGTQNGGWIQGRDYINPAVQPIFDKILNDAWREVTKA